MRDLTCLPSVMEISCARHGDDGQVGCPSVRVLDQISSATGGDGEWGGSTDRLDGDALGVDRAQVGVLKERDEV